jgi:hypothetical protein
MVRILSRTAERGKKTRRDVETLRAVAEWRSEGWG